uniref:Uncharacterized protein n=1 Tax=Streptococcus thermophilus TaxID=1308 RepID=A0A4Y5FQF1_STRTR|nr:hypothetical protein eps30b_0006 [Streptococcus thermophilus]
MEYIFLGQYSFIFDCPENGYFLVLLKSAKSLEPETLRYSIGYQVMAK